MHNIIFCYPNKAIVHFAFSDDFSGIWKFAFGLVFGRPETIEILFGILGQNRTSSSWKVSENPFRTVRTSGTWDEQKGGGFILPFLV
jgi:hypothetical protein